MTLFRLLFTSCFTVTLLVTSSLLQAKTDTSTSSQPVHIAVASNFTFAMKALIAEFKETTGHSVKASYGSSGKIYAQITHGAPFDVFFSADQAKPMALEEKQLIVDGSRFTYAVGALVLWSVQTNLVDDQGAILKANAFNKLALANPKLAPYGTAAMEVLTHLNLVETTRKRWIQGENIAQTYQFISTGNAELGFVSLAQLKQTPRAKQGSSWVIPQTLYSPIKQDVVLLKRGQENTTALAFHAFVQSPKARAIIESFGYTTLNNPTQTPQGLK